MTSSRRLPNRKGMSPCVGLAAPAILALWARSLNGYIDPGSGSFIFQAVIGGLLAVGVAIRAFRGKIVGAFKREPRKPAQP